VHEAGAFGDAILLCMDCFQAVDTLGAFKVSRCCLVQQHQANSYLLTASVAYSQWQFMYFWWVLQQTGSWQTDPDTGEGTCCISFVQVEPELRLTVQQQYYDTQQRLGTALLNVCSDFTLQGYSKVSK
jgi:hypothetical protein